jgi:N-hydroxyarylamine O-acetyltransferase
MSDSLDLNAYFERINWGGGTNPTFATLAGLLRAHLLLIPFENLDILLGRGVRLDLDGLQAKLIHAHRGGYCFEHSILFAAVLEKLGFHTVRHTARVILSRRRRERTCFSR